jgi:hypothetical protein
VTCDSETLILKKCAFNKPRYDWARDSVRCVALGGLTNGMAGDERAANGENVTSEVRDLV